MKKLLALGIALMLMLSFAGSALAAEVATNFYGTTYTAGTKTNSMEWVLATEGDTQTFKLNPASDYTVSSDIASGARWLLLKINIGRGWFFSETTPATLDFNFYRVYTGDTTVHIIPSGKAEWTKVNNALQNGLTGMDKLAVPELTGEEPSGTYAADKNYYNKKCSVKLTADDLEACYNKEDGCLYMTLAVTTTAATLPKLTTTAAYNDGKYHSLKLYGTQVLKDPNVSFEDALNTLSISNTEVTVVTNAGTGTAGLYVASYVDDEMVDVMLQTLSAEDAEGIHSVDISSLLPGTKKRAFLLANGTLVPLADAAEKTFEMKQETFVGANQENTKLSDFYSMSETAFVIPGLNQAMVPQGIEYREDTNKFYLSGYFKSGSSSVICVVDGDTGELVGEYFLKNKDGSVFAGHVGGVAADENNLYIAHGCYICRVPFSVIDSLGYMGDLYIEEIINVSIGELSNTTNRGCSYVDYSNGYLWVGNYYATGSSTYDKPVHEDYAALVRAYKMDSTQPNGFALENKAKNTDVYDYVPEMMFFVSQEKVQGATTSGDYLILSSSSGTSTSKLNIYDRTNSTAQAVMLLDEDREIPVHTLEPAKTVSAPPYSEEITAAGNFAYLIFESGAQAYRDNSNAYPTDSIWKMELNKLLPFE